MFDMGFDMYAMVKPKTKADVLAILREAGEEASRINNIFSDTFAQLALEQTVEPKPERQRCFYAYGQLEMTQLEWVQFLGISHTVFYARVGECGWCMEEAIRRFIQEK